MADSSTKLGKVIHVDEQQVKDLLGEIVRGTVEETLNGLLDAEADKLCNAMRYERSPDRQDTRADSYTRGLETKAGKVELRVPKLRKLPFETAIIERYRRRESSVEEALVEMHLAGVPVRRVEDITEALWGSRVSPSTVSKINQRIYKQIDAWRNRPIDGEFPYVYLDGIYLKRSWGGEERNVAVLVAYGVAQDGNRRILGVSEGGRARGQRRRRDAHLMRLPQRALAPNPHERSDGADHAGDKTTHARRWLFCRRRVGADARGGQAPPHLEDEVGLSPLLEHGAAPRAG